MTRDESVLSIPTAEMLGEKYATWLQTAKPEFLARILPFVATLSIDALRASACRAMKSECTNVYHIATGGFNAVYLLTFLNGRELVARMNKEEQTSDQSLLRDRLLSEAATLRYIQIHCSVPVPHVRFVNDELPNPVGSRYILEDRIYGRELSMRGYTTAQRRDIAIQIFHCEAELIRARFTSIGSIYHRAEDDIFYVGPMGPTVCRPLNHTVDRGPWKSTCDWLKAYIKSELAGIRQDPEKYRQVRNRYRVDNGNPHFQYHVAWLETFLSTMDKLQYLKSLLASVERPVLHHEDLSGGNIIVSFDPSITLAGIIDFEGARVVPLWSAMAAPDFSEVDDDEAEETSLLELRQKILSEADPACTEAQIHYESLKRLRWLACMGVTIWCSIEMLHERYKTMKEAWPIHEPAFADLDKLIAIGPTGYIEGGRV